MAQLSFWDEQPNNGAIIDGSGAYRYSLWRVWNSTLPRLCFILLNPSIADASIDDPTLRRCISFAKSLECGSLEIVNLFAFRSPYPRDLLETNDPVGSENDTYILNAVKQAKYVVCGWGVVHPRLLPRVSDVRNLLVDYALHCFGRTKEGHPRHPLYLRSDALLEGYPAKGE